MSTRSGPHKSSSDRKRLNLDINEFTCDDYDVANTLIDLLPSLYIKSKSKSKCLFNLCYPFSYDWVNKRRRSAVDKPPCRVAPPPSATVFKSSATSPDTPLGLCTIESDDYNIKFDKSIKKVKEKLHKMIEERIQTQLTLKVGIEKVKQHLEELKAQNCELKLKRHKELKLKRHKLMEQKTAVNDMLQSGPSTSIVYNQHQPLISHHQVYFPNQTVHNQLGPRGFDLNVSAEEMEVTESGLQPLDQEMMMIRNVMMNRAIAAQARHKRIVINKSKKETRVR